MLRGLAEKVRPFGTPTSEAMMDCSFAADGSWFVFDTHTGKTLERGFKSKGLAIAWMAQQLRANPAD